MPALILPHGFLPGADLFWPGPTTFLASTGSARGCLSGRYDVRLTATLLVPPHARDTDLLDVPRHNILSRLQALLGDCAQTVCHSPEFSGSCGIHTKSSDLTLFQFIRRWIIDMKMGAGGTRISRENPTETNPELKQRGRHQYSQPRKCGRGYAFFLPQDFSPHKAIHI